MSNPTHIKCWFGQVKHYHNAVTAMNSLKTLDRGLLVYANMDDIQEFCADNVFSGNRQRFACLLAQSIVKNQSKAI